MRPVVSPHLLAVDAAWDDTPDAGSWIAERLGPYGTSVGHAVPLGYEAYAVVPIALDDATHADRGALPAIEVLVDALGPLTRQQPVHFGMWDGWAWWYDTGSDPRDATSMAVLIPWPEGEQPPAQKELDLARERLASRRVERPDVEPLDLPYRRYYLWTGPLRSAMAFAHEPHTPPSLIWPDDRSWFLGAPIYTNEIAVAGTTAAVDAVIDCARLNARQAAPDDGLDIDD